MKKFALLFLVMSAGLLGTAQSVAQRAASRNAAFHHQLRLIDSIRQYIRHELKMNIGDRFYTDWEEDRTDSMYIFLYVSRKDSIKVPVELRQGLWFFESEDSARLKSTDLMAKGYETLVYKTAGLSNTRLNTKLLSYPDEAIAFIVFHEAVHVHVGDHIRYIFNESLADALANRACVHFAQKTGMLNLRAVQRQRMIFEKAYALLNKKRKEAEALPVERKPEVFSKCERKIHGLVKRANQFQKDRMRYEVNNAYFLRVEAYAVHYFDLSRKLKELQDIDRVIAGLPPPLQPDNTD